MPEDGDITVNGVDIEGVREVLRSRDLEFALLFGSHARGEAHKSSDVDITLRFPETMDNTERFRERNRIDAELQAHASGFVDVSDIETLPTPVAYAALRDGIPLVGDRETVESVRAEIEAEYESTAEQRKREREELIDRLARGDI